MAPLRGEAPMRSRIDLLTAVAALLWIAMLAAVLAYLL